MKLARQFDHLNTKKKNLTFTFWTRKGFIS